MKNSTFHSLRGNAQERTWHDEDDEAGRFARLDQPPWPARSHVRGQDAIGLLFAGGSAWLLMLIVFWAAARLTESGYPIEIGWLVFWRSLLALTAITPLVSFAAWIFLTVRERLAYVERIRLIRDRMMNPIPVHLLSRLTLAEYAHFYERALAHEESIAPFQIYRGVEEVHVNAVRGPSAPGGGGMLSPSLLIDPVEIWIDDVARREAHILLAGKTASGKTTTGAALLARRIDAGDYVLVIDPHAEPGKWWGIDTVVGAGRDYEAIGVALAALEREMDRRYRQLSEGLPIGSRLTVLIDEAPAISDALDKRWKSLTTRLGSEARKVGIAMIMLSQSPLVEDLQLNSIMRRNYSIIGLDMPSIRQMVREARIADKEALLEALEGRPYPALREIDGVFRICDRSGIERIRPTRPPAVWSVPRLPIPPERPKWDTDNEQELLELLTKLRRAGVTREQAREAGFQFDNTLWTRAGELLALEPNEKELPKRSEQIPVTTATLPLAPSAEEERNSRLQEEEALPYHNGGRRITRCKRCQAPVEIPEGKSEMSVLATTARYGCEHCKSSREERKVKGGRLR
ncbi:MAG: type IV secretory system conjugative DNA transfer family protein [Candidatus Kapabacteria bacterium]|nr:type IV secretory system conjugative DNA transfer family protein [Candidatus Kapabacteria bacterium]